MYLAYMDESGNTGKKADPDQSIHYIGCLIVEDNKVRDLEDAVCDIGRTLFPDRFTEPRFEFHGIDLFSGSGFFKGVKPEVRIDATRQIIAAANDHAAAFGHVGVDKEKSYANDHPHRICFTMLMERLEDYLEYRDALALLVSDENSEMEQDLIADIKTFKEANTKWGYKKKPIKRVIDSVHFVKSFNNPVIQAADVITWHLRREKSDKNRHLHDYVASGMTQNWLEFLNASSSRADKAVRELIAELKLHRFASKIWPS